MDYHIHEGDRCVIIAPSVGAAEFLESATVLPWGHVFSSPLDRFMDILAAQPARKAAQAAEQAAVAFAQDAAEVVNAAFIATKDVVGIGTAAGGGQGGGGPGNKSLSIDGSSGSISQGLGEGAIAGCPTPPTGGGMGGGGCSLDPQQLTGQQEEKEAKEKKRERVVLRTGTAVVVALAVLESRFHKKPRIIRSVGQSMRGKVVVGRGRRVKKPLLVGDCFEDFLVEFQGFLCLPERDE